jgi:hypothetical protein
MQDTGRGAEAIILQSRASTCKSGEVEQEYGDRGWYQQQPLAWPGSRAGDRTRGSWVR